MRELRFGAAVAGLAGAGLRRLAVPQDPVAWRVRHRAAAAELVEQAAGAGALTEGHRGLLVFVELHAGAAGLGEGLEEGLGPLQIIEGDVAGTAGGQRDQNLGNPVRVRRAAGDVDNRQAGLRLEVRAQESALVALVELQSGRTGRVRLHRRDAAPARAVADGDDDAGLRRHLGDPVLHRAVGEHVHPAGSIGPLDDRALENEDVHRPSAAGAVPEDLLRLIAQLKAK